MPFGALAGGVDTPQARWPRRAKAVHARPHTIASGNAITPACQARSANPPPTAPIP
jgi:hypothetical protein